MQWLVDWYQEQCDGDWEREYGVRIVSIGNPGWIVEIGLAATEAQTAVLPWRIIERTELDWVHCKIEASEFFGAGGVQNLCEIFEIFLSTVDPEMRFRKSRKELVWGTSTGTEVAGKTELVKLLVDWYQEQCDDEAWEEGPAIGIASTSNPGWEVDIELEGTKGENLEVLPMVRIERSELDWVHWKIEDGKFLGRGGVNNLFEIIEIFLSAVDTGRLSQVRDDLTEKH